MIALSAPTPITLDEFNERTKQHILASRFNASDFLQGFIHDFLVEIEDEWKVSLGIPVDMPMEKIEPEQRDKSRELLRLAIEVMGEGRTELEKQLIAMAKGLLAVF